MEGDNTVYSHNVGYDKHAGSLSHSPTSPSVPFDVETNQSCHIRPGSSPDSSTNHGTLS
jgi:hypothetical protein